MKKQFILILAIVMIFAACKKSDNSSSNNNNNNNTTGTNTITVTDDGVTYTSNGSDPVNGLDTNYVIGSLETGSGYYGSECGFVVKGVKYSFNVDLDGQFGPSNGIGKYTAPGTGRYTETPNTPIIWAITNSSTMNVTSTDNNRFKGTFTLNLANPTGNKTITGTFDCKQY